MLHARPGGCAVRIMAISPFDNETKAVTSSTDSCTERHGTMQRGHRPHTDIFTLLFLNLESTKRFG